MVLVGRRKRPRLKSRRRGFGGDVEKRIGKFWERLKRIERFLCFIVLAFGVSIFVALKFEK